MIMAFMWRSFFRWRHYQTSAHSLSTTGGVSDKGNGITYSSSRSNLRCCLVPIMPSSDLRISSNFSAVVVLTL